jgi:hypothetical protein
MRHLKGITIGVVGTLLVLYLAVYTPWRTGGRQGEKDSAGGLNVAQDANSPATSAPDVKQPARDVKQPARNVRQPADEVKQRGTSTQGAKWHAKNVKSSTAKMRQDMKWQGEDVELQDIETQDGEQLIIDVRQPAEDVDAVYTEYEEEFEESFEGPVDTEYMKDSSDWPTAARIYIAVPESQQCPTPYEIWGDPSGQ